MGLFESRVIARDKNKLVKRKTSSNCYQLRTHPSLLVNRIYQRNISVDRLHHPCLKQWESSKSDLTWLQLTFIAQLRWGLHPHPQSEPANKNAQRRNAPFSATLFTARGGTIGSPENDGIQTEVHYTGWLIGIPLLDYYHPQ